MLLYLCKYIFIQHIRLPVSFIWTLALPTILYLTFQYDMKALSLLGSYIIFSSYAYGNSMYLISCRESGFLKCLIRGKRALAVFSLALYTVNTFILMISLAVFYTVIYIIDGINFYRQLLYLSLFSPVLFFISLNVLNYRTESSEVYTVLSIAIMLFLIISLYEGQYSTFINHLNPLYIYGAIAYADENLSYIASCCFMSLTGLLGLYRFNYQPVEGRV